MLKFTTYCFLTYISYAGVASAYTQLLHGGGGLTDDTYRYWARVIKEQGSQLCIFGTNSANPSKAAKFYAEQFELRGIVAKEYLVTIGNSGYNNKPILLDGKLFTEHRTDSRRYSSFENWKSELAECDGFWFGGGDQSRSLLSLINQDASLTPLAKALRDKIGAGSSFGGTSAGAAMQGHPIILGGNSADSLLKSGEVARTHDGLEIFQLKLLVDQHFLARGRIGRLLQVMEENQVNLAVGLDEKTGLVVRGSAPAWFVTGAQQVLIVERLEADTYRLHLLSDGDQYIPSTQQVIPISHSTEIKTSETKGNLVWSFPAFSEYALTNAILNLVKEGLSQTTLNSDSENGQISLKISRSPDTQAWLCSESCKKKSSSNDRSNDIATVIGLTMQVTIN